MKKFLTIIFLLIGFCLPTFAQSDAITLPSASGRVLEVETDYENESADKNITQYVKVKILSGEFKGQEKVLENILTENPVYDIPLEKGDKVVLHLEDAEDSGVNFFIADIKRDNAILIFAGIFCAILIIIGRKKGVYSLISIIATIGLIFALLVPLVLHGFCPIIASIIVGVLSTVITIYLVGGLNSKSTSAVLGTTVSLIFAGILSILAIVTAHLTGFAGEENLFLYGVRPDLSFRGILSASMIIAALGALMDTSVSIASTINEIHETDNSLGVVDLFKSGMNVGRDIIGTMSNTLILVYLGSSLPLVLLGSNIDLQKFFNLNQVATEILSATIGSIAILACVPITAIIASYLIKNKKEKVEFKF